MITPEEANIRIKELGLRKSHVAKKISIQPQTLSSILSKKISYVSPDVMERLEAYLGECRT